MTNEQLQIVTELRSQGLGYKSIARTTGLSENTIKAHCRRHPLSPGESVCPTCGKVLTQTPQKRAKKFCSDKCRMAWWNAHPEMVSRKAFYHLVCAHCGRPFDSYGNNHRKYCSRSCYNEARRKGVLECPSNPSKT
jgi:endogenous inhibitor of DNA gyrase (YacG/DUF329 family)